MKKIILSLLFVSTAGFGLPETLKDTSIIELSKSKYRVIDRTVHYPGMAQNIINSRFQGGDASDCLILFDSSDTKKVDYKLLKRVTDSIVVIDANNKGMPHNVLTPKFIQNTYVYFLKDLGKYLTEVQVKTKLLHTTLGDVIEDIFGKDHNVGLVFSKNCRLLRH